MMNLPLRVSLVGLLTAATCSLCHAFVQPRQQGVLRPTTDLSPAYPFSPLAQPSPQVVRSRTFPLYMGWGPEPIWTGAQVVENTVACPSGSCVSVKVQLDPEVGAEYKVPGQYVQLRLNGDMEKPLFLAIASAPDAENCDSFEFLVKKTEGNEWLTSAAPGLAVEISQVLGNGFPTEEHFDGFTYDFPTQNVLLFATGSGIAPLKACMESGIATQGGRTARLYYGVQTDADLCFVEDFSKWEAQGIQVVPVLSQPTDSWQGRTGYVQNALEEDGVPIPRNCGALLCGVKGMVDSVKDVLTKAGVFEGRCLTNF